MRPDIKKFVFHLCWAPEKVKAEDVSCLLAIANLYEQDMNF